MDQQTYERVFEGYRKPNSITIPKYESINKRVKELGDEIMALVPPSAEKTLALRDLQRCRMMANAGIAIYSEEPTDG